MDYIKTYYDKFSSTFTETEHKYYDYIKNKRIAVVGPSPWLNNKGLGEKIDEYDVIVRINQGIFLPEQNAKDYGSRTDIIYTSQKARDKYKFNFPQIFHETKFICLLTQKKWKNAPGIEITCFKCKKRVNEGEEYCLKEDWEEGDPIQLGHPICVYKKIDYSHIPTNVLRRDIGIYQSLFGVSLLSGVFAIIEMIKFHAKKIDVYGFDFYNGIKQTLRKDILDTKVTDIYCDGYPVMKGTLTHSHKDTDGKQLFLLKTLMEKFPMIDVDENLKKIMDENFSRPIPPYHKYDNEYKNFIRGKNVIIVGPAPWLKGKKLGKLIDSHDVVVRLNMGLYLAQDNPEDFGKKVNVLYLNTEHRLSIGTDFPSIYETPGYICMESMQHDKDVPFVCKICSKNIEKGDEYIVEKSPLHLTCKSFIDYDLCLKKVLSFDAVPLERELGEHPLLGMSAIKHLLGCNPKSINVFGFDFYNAVKNAIRNKTDKISPSDLYTEGYKVLSKVEIYNMDERGIQLKKFKKWQKTNKIYTDTNLKKIVKNF